mmetsp:Transcript_41781/g.115138  ORF Transcript_41781/g.115138 Transcript_41781/m.115138 type:complete len:278 (-) Transcript_41781:821-1654(-)
MPRECPFRKLHDPPSVTRASTADAQAVGHMHAIMDRPRRIQGGKSCETGKWTSSLLLRFRQRSRRTFVPPLAPKRRLPRGMSVCFALPWSRFTARATRNRRIGQLPEPARTRRQQVPTLLWRRAAEHSVRTRAKRHRARLLALPLPTMICLRSCPRPSATICLRPSPKRLGFKYPRKYQDCPSSRMRPISRASASTSAGSSRARATLGQKGRVGPPIGRRRAPSTLFARSCEALGLAMFSSLARSSLAALCISKPSVGSRRWVSSKRLASSPPASSS